MCPVFVSFTRLVCQAKGERWLRHTSDSVVDDYFINAVIALSNPVSHHTEFIEALNVLENTVLNGGVYLARVHYLQDIVTDAIICSHYSLIVASFKDATDLLSDERKVSTG
jgi:hypothetical protein